MYSIRPLWWYLSSFRNIYMDFPHLYFQPIFNLIILSGIYLRHLFQYTFILLIWNVHLIFFKLYTLLNIHDISNPISNSIERDYSKSLMSQRIWLNKTYFRGLRYKFVLFCVMIRSIQSCQVIKYEHKIIQWLKSRPTFLAEICSVHFNCILMKCP